MARLTNEDQQVLEFLAAHRLAVFGHVVVLLGKDRELATERLGGLVAAELVRGRPVMRSEPDCFQITRAGLSSIGSELPPPDFEPRYRHDVGVAWLWLASTRGAFGPAERVLTERELRSRDTGRRQARDIAQYPDLLLIRGSRRVALLLQLASPSRQRLERLLVDYAANTPISAVVFLVAGPRIGTVIRSAATDASAALDVHIQPVKFEPDAQ